MKQIKVEYFYKDQPYGFNNEIFDYNHIMSITETLQRKYSKFAQQINDENGYIKIDLSHVPNSSSTIHYEAFVLGISDKLTEQINEWNEAHPNEF